MEHLLLDVAAAPLRLIAAKNEKSRSELGRFLTKQVRTGARGKCPPTRAGLFVPRAPALLHSAFKGREKRRLVALALSPGLASGGRVHACLGLEGTFCFYLGELSLPFSTDPLQRSDPVWQTGPSESNVVCFSAIEVACNFAMWFP